MTDHDKSAEQELEHRLYGHRPCSECNGYENTECERCGSRGVVEVGEVRHDR